jgi:putative NADH-flavin reductase
MLGNTYDDMKKMEEVLFNSEFDWISLRPPHLIKKPATGHYRMDIAPLPKGRNLTYGDLAAALLDSLSRTDVHHQALYVAN